MGASHATTYYNIPHFFQDYDTNNKPVVFGYAKFNDAVDGTKAFLVSRYPATKPQSCQVVWAYQQDANLLAQGYEAKVNYVSNDPTYTCPGNVIDIRLTTYDHDPEKNTGDSGNCSGGIGLKGGDGTIICPAKTLVADPINFATGNKYEQATDFEASTWLTFRRFYNSQASVRASSMGPQWRHSFDRALLSLNTSPSGTGSSYLLLQRPDGRSERFRPTANGGWAADPNIADTLTADQTGYTVYIAGPDQFERYSTTGQLQYIADASGQTTTLTYSGSQLQTVTDPLGRTLTFGYDGNGLVHTVTQPDGGVLTYSYTNGLLTSVQYPDGKTKQYIYNESTLTGGTNLPNAITGVTDESGVRYENTSYNANGQAISSSQAGGANQTTLSGMTANGATMVTPLGATTTYATKDDGYGGIKLTNAFMPCHTSWCYQTWQSITYDANGYPNQYVDFSSNKTNTTYNSVGLETQRIEAVGQGYKQRTINTTWDTVLRHPLTRVTLDNNNKPVTQSAWTYNAAGQVTARCDIDPNVTGATSYACGSATNAPSGIRQWTSTYCTAVDTTQCPVTGLLLSEDGPRTDVSDVTHYSYYLTTDLSGCAATDGTCHRAGDLYQVTDAAAHITTYAAYDGAGRITRLVDPNGVVTKLTYTPRGWLQTRSVGGATTTYAYKPYGALASFTDPDGVTITYGYDDAHRLTDITDAQGNHIHYNLDATGNQVDEATYVVGSSTPVRHLSRTFNNLSQLTKVIDGLNHTVFDATASNAYNLRGDLLTSVDALGVKRARTYDGHNLLNTVQDSATVNGTTQTDSVVYVYDLLDRLIQITPFDNRITTYAYDGLNNQTSTTSVDTGTVTSTFDAAGNMLTRTDAKNIVTTTAYDALNRATATTYTDSTLNVTRSYDEPDNVTGCTGSYPVGRLTRIVEASVTTSYCYDSHGNVTRKSQTQGAATDITTYGYTAGDRLSSIQTPSGTSIQYQRDANGRVSTVSALPPGSTGAGAGNIATAITYLPFGPISSYTLGNGQTVTRSYDLNYQFTDITSPTLNLHFARDAMGKITALGNAAGASPALETYSYDWLSELTSVQDASGTTLESYTYDYLTNRTSKTGSGLATGAYNYWRYPAHWLTNIGSTSRTYDANGNTTASSVGGESFGFGYNGRNRMTVVQRNSNTVGTYTYNAMGERTAKSATLPSTINQRFSYNEDSQLLGEYGNNTRDYVWLDDVPLAVIDTSGSTSSTNYVHTDGLNTPRAVTDGSGAVQWQWPYQSNPFGEKQPTSSNGFTYNLRFAGQYYDAESNLAYNVNRTYEAATGRYLQSDPTGLAGGLGLYTYVSNSPLLMVDPFGLQEYGYNPPNSGGSKPPRMGVGCVIGIGVVVAGAAIACAPSGPGEAVCIPAAGVFAAGALGCAGGAAVANATDDSNDNVIPFPRPMSRSFPGTCPPEDNNDREKRCNAVKQSILATCASLRGKKQMYCFQAAQDTYNKCMED